MKKKPAIKRPWPPANRMISPDQVTTRGTNTKPQASSPKPHTK